MTRKPRQQRALATVDTIIEAGFICVAELGAANTTTRHIADRAGLSVGSLYEYFENKEAVFDAMYRHLIREIVARIEPLMPQLVQKDIVEAIEMLFEAFRELLRENNERYLRVANQALLMDDRDYVEPLNKALMSLLMQYLMHRPELLRIRNIPAMSYIFINSAVLTVLRHLRDPNPPITFQQLSRGIAEMIEHYAAHELWLLEKSSNRS